MPKTWWILGRQGVPKYTDQHCLDPSPIKRVMIKIYRTTILPVSCTGVKPGPSFQVIINRIRSIFYCVNTTLIVNNPSCLQY